MKYKNTEEVKVKNAEDIDPRYLTRAAKEVKEITVKAKGKVIVGESNNDWMMSKYW